MQLVDKLIERIRDSGLTFDPAVQIAPSCVLWTDKDRQWEKAISIFSEKMPELLILGEYLPEKRTGPAIWLRVAIIKKTNAVELQNKIPVIYLPGISRQDLRDVENCPEHLKPLAELQFHGIIWSQGSKDWTILAFLRAKPGGFAVEIDDKTETKTALLRALKPLLHSEIEQLADKSIDKEFLNNLLACDYIRYMLEWLNQPDNFKSTIDNDEWQAFIETCKSKLLFNPEEEGNISAATKLASHTRYWNPIWERFCLAPNRYPNIPELIQKCKPPKSLLWQNPDQKEYDRWPQYNQEQEDNLRKELKNLDTLTSHKAQEKINDLEKDHGSRRNLVWAEIGKTPLSEALKHLSILSKITANPLTSLTAGTAQELSTIYQNNGWQADEAMINAFDSVEKQEDLGAVKTAITTIYKPWIEESARYLQKIVYEKGYPGNNVANQQTPQYEKAECILFVDGLRFDIAKRLAKMLSTKGHQIEEKPIWAALPSVTATGKPAVTPVRNKIQGEEVNSSFEPNVVETNQPLTSYNLKKLLTEAGWETTETPSSEKPENNAWFESIGNVDDEGHTKGWKLAKHIDEILREIQDQVDQLLEANWKKVHIVTDHGWLLLPDGLPKSELPKSLTLTKWGRCAAIKPGAYTKEKLYPWYWNPNQHFALADGVSCFRNGVEYDHGGISLQECLTLHLIVTPGARAAHIAPKIINKTWKGLRCNIIVDGVFEDLYLDIRTQPAKPSSSVTKEPKQLKTNGTTSLIVENMDLEGTAAIIVLTNKKGELLAQTSTTIGEE